MGEGRSLVMRERESFFSFENLGSNELVVS